MLNRKTAVPLVNPPVLTPIRYKSCCGSFTEVSTGDVQVDTSFHVDPASKLRCKVTVATNVPDTDTLKRPVNNAAVLN